MEYTRALPYHVASCPRCPFSHSYTLAVKVDKQVATFGGRRASQRSFDVALECATTHELFDWPVAVDEASDEHIQTVSVATGPAEDPDWLRDERNTWQRESVAVARSFAQIMLSTSLGAIPVYFAVVNYLAIRHHQVAPWLGVTPPVLFIVSAGTYALALHPVLRMISTTDDFFEFRNKRLAQVNTRLIRASIVFAAALALTVIVFAISLYRR
jgi:hypothetical protein